MASDDLAPYLRDWRMEQCEHYDADICSPCIRDRILASDWLAAHDREVAARAWSGGFEAGREWGARGEPGPNPYR